MAQGKNNDLVRERIVFIQREIAGAAARDHQFSQNTVHRPADRGVGSQHLQRAEHEIVGCQRRNGFILEQEIHQPAQVGVRAPRYDYFRHERSFGLRVLRPCSFAR